MSRGATRGSAPSPRSRTWAGCPRASRRWSSAACTGPRLGTGVPGTGDATWIEVEPIEDPEPTARAEELGREYRATVENIVESRGVPQVAEFLRGITEPGALADTAGYSPDMSFEQKVAILEELDVERRLELVLEHAKKTLADVELKDKIRTEVTEGIDKRQREFLLREQMAAIRKELGEDGEEDVAESYRTRIAEAGMPEEVQKQAEQELGRLERTSEQNPEYGWIRTYLDWLLDVPWNVRTDDQLDVGRGAGDPGRGPHRPGGREGPHHRVPGRPQAARRARADRDDRRPRVGRDPDPGRPAGRRQDLAG